MCTLVTGLCTYLWIVAGRVTWSVWQIGAQTLAIHRHWHVLHGRVECFQLVVLLVANEHTTERTGAQCWRNVCTLRASVACSLCDMRTMRVHSRTIDALVVALINAYAAAADDDNSVAAGDGTRAKPGVGGVDSADVAVLVSTIRGDTCVDNDVLVLACYYLYTCARCGRTHRVHTNLLCNGQRFNSLRQCRHVVQSSRNIFGSVGHWKTQCAQCMSMYLRIGASLCSTDDSLAAPA